MIEARDYTGTALMRAVNSNITRRLLPQQQISPRKWRDRRVVVMVRPLTVWERCSGVPHLER
jgi:hypothetical protein